MDIVIQDVLEEGLVDWTDPGWVMACLAARRTSQTPEKKREESLKIIDFMLSEGLVIAGNVTDDGFVPWRMNLEEMSAQIRRDWSNEWGFRPPTPGAIGWFQNTDKGDEIIKTLLREEEERKKNVQGNGQEA